MRGLALTLLVGSVAIGWLASGVTPSRPLAASTPPPMAQAPAWKPHASAGTMTVDRSWNGHFYVGGDIAGTPLRFMVDTGASIVALGEADARKAGIVVGPADYVHEVQTAGGAVRAAPVTLPRLRVGDIQLMDVEAVVVDEDMPPLLGQSFLQKLERVSIEKDRLTLEKL